MQDDPGLSREHSADVDDSVGCHATSKSSLAALTADPFTVDFNAESAMCASASQHQWQPNLAHMVVYHMSTLCCDCMHASSDH